MKEQKEKRSKSNTGGMCLVFIIIMLVVLVLGVLDTANTVRRNVANMRRTPIFQSAGATLMSNVGESLVDEMKIQSAILACEVADSLFDSAGVDLPRRDCEARAYANATATAQSR